MTEPQTRMLRVLAAQGVMQREMLFSRCGSHRSGYRTLGKLADMGFISFSKGYPSGVRVHMTDAGRAAVSS